MNEKKNPAELFEQEISKQIDEMDKRIDRGGMISLILIVIALFVAGYWIIEFFSISRSNASLQYETQYDLIERIDQLESRIEILEQKE